MVSDQSVSSFMEKAKTVSECLHAYGIHSATIQPELVAKPLDPASEPVVGSSSVFASASASSTMVRNRKHPITSLRVCQMLCGKGICENLMCCTAQM